MNRRMDKAMIRLYSCMEGVPLPITGAWAKSADVSGFITYGKDMSVAKPALLTAMFHIRMGELDEAEEILTSLEKWIDMRNKQGWKDIFPFPSLEKA